MKRFVLFVLVAGLVLAVSGAWALTLQGQAGYGWYTWTANDNGDPYWDNPSSEPNIGEWLLSKGYGSLKTWASGAGAADPEVQFTNGTEWAAILIEIAGFAPNNKFGYYVLNSGNPVKTELFDGSAGPNQSKLFNVPIGSNFGFYLTSPQGTFYTQSSLNQGADQGLQHFAFFEAPTPPTSLITNPTIPPSLLPLLRNGYIIGAEDLKGLGDKDYNDFVVYVANVVPDASTWMLFLSGMPALALLRRKRA
ncbi:MAG: DUF4114 domain-containing protein [Firmicutes bacterium]|nr:DUF4114 domain-containing protein [Bacillota bacterium]